MTTEVSWHEWMRRIHTRADAQINTLGPALFTTDAPELFEVFLTGFSDPTERQYNNCHACANFLRKYGGLVCLDANGRAISPFWSVDDAPAAYKPAVWLINDVIQHARVTGVFYSGETAWGQAHTNRPIGAECDHFAYQPQQRLIYQNALKNSGQASAEKGEDFKSVMLALEDWSLEHVELAQGLLTALYMQGAAILSVLAWFVDLKRRYAAEKNAKQRTNLVWRAIATAPAGFAHLRGGMTGSLLDDIALGVPAAEVVKNYDAKVHPLAYQRPQAPPKAGNVARAETVIEKLGLTKALYRRFAKTAEVPLLWQPHSAPVHIPTEPSGVFGGVTTRTPPHTLSAPLTVNLPDKRMTWTVFARDVLPHATALAYQTLKRDHYTAIVAPMHADAPSLFQWANPFNWYRYYSGSEAANWNLTPGTWVQIAGVTHLPWMWDADFRGTQFEKGVLFILPNCIDTTNSASALFPGVLKADLHEVRATIEQFSQQHTLGDVFGAGLANACGVLFRGTENPAPVTLRVTQGRSVQDITLDRWE